MGEGKYLYCFIRSPMKKEFDVEGIGGNGRKVYTINHKELAAVVCDSPDTEYYKVDRKNTTLHESAIHKVMEEHTVLPVGFGCVAKSGEQIKSNVLEKHYDELSKMLQDMEGKLEIGLKAIWRDNQIIYQELLKEEPRIKQSIDRLIHKGGSLGLTDVVLKTCNLGDKLLAAIDRIKKRESERLLASLEPLALDRYSKKIFSPLMILNQAFLIANERKKDFDDKVDDLDQRCGKDIRFMYSGPLPPYSFVNLHIALE